MKTMYDFANILFSGGSKYPCNARCPYCIGGQIDPRLNADNLNLYPPRHLDRFIELVDRHAVRQVVFTGTNTDPQLYRHEQRLIAHLRGVLPGVQLSLHTNGRLALKKMDTFNLYDRVSISLPSFHPLTYRKMMGVPHQPDLAEILRHVRAPVKISCLVTDDNAAGTGAFLQGCRALGIHRVVLRKLYGERRSWRQLLPQRELSLVRRGTFRGNPVYDLDGMEVTLWDFARAQAVSINLFSSGVISTEYLLARPGIVTGLSAFTFSSWVSKYVKR
jgi:MoaA/NifB/PqqE/SkfB family radical SAM enzyme